jgi:hypothetical protein
MTYHTLLGNNVMPKFRHRKTVTRATKRTVLLCVSMTLYGVMIMLLTRSTFC